MNVSAPGDPGQDGLGTRAVHVDHSRGIQIGDDGTQDNRFMPVAASRDALVAGRDLHVAFAAVPPSVATRSSYLEQVRRIAPPDPPGLRDRDAELAELSRFCLDPDGPPYAWWRAEAWAGKSALLATFVLRPPEPVAEQVRIVSFFITARLAAQDNREAFTQVLLEQLAELAEEVLPATLPEATREGYLLNLLAKAAAACRRAGRRLVLVVDGLDEDRGVTTGPDAHSIAGLLPADPPHGLRVIVAGRPNPPVPDDVPDWHPLRDPAIIRPLPASPHARDMQRLGRQELHRLLGDTAGGRDLLGLLAAARGGLSSPDLAELTGIPLWEVEQTLHTAAGRTFTRRASRWAPAARPETYLLGHEELQASAVRYLAGQLAGYQDRLHAWADAYRDQGWPEETPEYLLSGYYALLTALDDLPRMVRCATDLARHDRMLAVIGGDVAALAEARLALDRVSVQQTPDLVWALTLARHRDRIIDRNSRIPVGLPAIWAALGQVTRAEALAASAGDPYLRAEALARVADALVAAGPHQQAVSAVKQAETAAQALTDPRLSAEALARVAGLTARIGQHEHAAAVTGQAADAARLYVDPGLQVTALAGVASALAEAGQHERAGPIARQAEVAAWRIVNPQAQLQALAKVAKELAKAGHHRRAILVAEQAETLARAVTGPDQVRDLLLVAETMAHAGQRERAAEMAGQAEAVARTISEPAEQAEQLEVIARSLARMGEHDQAEVLARDIRDPGQQAWVLALVAKSLAAGDEHERAVRTARLAEAKARAVTGLPPQAYQLKDVAAALAEVGDYEQAVSVARFVTSQQGRAMTLAAVVAVLAAAGQHGRAEAVARTIPGPRERADALVQVAGALVGAGRRQAAAELAAEAEEAVRSFTYPQRETSALAAVADALAEAGQPEQAVALAEQAETIAQAVTDPEERAWGLLAAAEAWRAAGRREPAAALAAQAEGPAGSILDLPEQARFLTSVSRTLAATGRRERAAAVARAAEAVARSIADAEEQANALGAAAEALVDAGEPERAEAVVRSITDPEGKLLALVRVGEALIKASHPEPGAALIWEAEAAARTLPNRRSRAMALAEVARALARAGEHQQAASVAASIAPPFTGTPVWRAPALAAAAGALAEVGQHQQAEATARSIADYPAYQDIAFYWVANAMAAAGQCQQAETAARAILHPARRAQSLARITEALVRTGDARSARRLAAEVCTLGSWLNVVTPVLRLDPSASAAVISMLTPRDARYAPENPVPGVP